MENKELIDKLKSELKKCYQLVEEGKTIEALQSIAYMDILLICNIKNENEKM